MLSRKTFCRGLGLLFVLGMSSPPAVADDAEREPPPPDVRAPHPDEPDSFDGPRPFGPGAFGRHHRRPLYEHLPEDVQLEILDFAEEHFPELYAEMIDLRYDAPRVFARKMNRLLPQIMELMRLEQDDPKVFPHRVKEVRITTRILVLMRRIRGYGDGDRDEELVARLRRLLEKRFDLRQKIHRIEVERLERRLAEAKARLDQAATDKDEIVARELEDVLIPLRRGKKPIRRHASPEPPPVKSP